MIAAASPKTWNQSKKRDRSDATESQENEIDPAFGNVLGFWCDGSLHHGLDEIRKKAGALTGDEADGVHLQVS